MKAYRALFLATLGLATFGTALAQPRLDPRIIPPLITPTQPAPNLIVDVCSSPRVSAFIGYPANATSAADFVEKLYGGYRQDGCPSSVGGWGTPDPDLTRRTGSREVTQRADDRDFDCRVDSYNITRTPEEIITFDPDAGVFWPGAILQGEGVSLGLGSLKPVSVPATKRAPLVLSVDLPMSGNRVVVPNPSDSTVTQALGELLERAGREHVAYGNALSYRKVEGYSLEQSALDLKLDAHYLGASVKGRLSFNRTASERTVTAFFIQKGFTVKVDLAGQRPAAALLGDGVSVADLVARARQGA